MSEERKRLDLCLTPQVRELLQRLAAESGKDKINEIIQIGFELYAIKPKDGGGDQSPDESPTAQ